MRAGRCAPGNSSCCWAAGGGGQGRGAAVEVEATGDPCWLSEDSPGMFAVTKQIARQTAEPQEPGSLR
jgi:hypothetical protein